MRYSIVVMFKLFVREYYKVNAGFFLFFFILLFGLVSPGAIISYHESIIKGILESVDLFLLAAFCWLLYQIKCLQSFNRMLATAENNFLVNLQCLSTFRRLLLLGGLHVVLFLPVGLYLLIVIYYGQTIGALRGVGLTLSVGLLFLVWGMLANYYQVTHGLRKEGWAQTFAFFNRIRLPKAYPLLLIHYVFSERKMALLLIKIFSFFLLLFTASLGEGVFYFENFLLFFHVIILSHAVLVHYMVRELETAMAFIRGLPISRNYRITIFLCAYAVILLPEIIFMLTNFSSDVPWYQLVFFYFSGVTQLLLFTGILYLPRIKMFRYIQLIVLIFAISELFLRPSTVMLFATVQLALAWLLFYARYYKYEIQH